MCGIFAYLGTQNKAGKLTVNGLKKLEYRGYDSFGFATQKPDGNFAVTKKTGKISEFMAKNRQATTGHLALGHTRWATHGRVIRANAHPHLSADGQVVVVHNGIIENHEILRRGLKRQKIKFLSETDTEIIPNLIANHLKRHDFSEAVRLATKKLHGRYAFVAGLVGTKTLVVARHGSPLILGIVAPELKENQTADKITGQEFFVASDVPAFLEYTQKVAYLDDEEMAIIIDSEISFQKIADGTPIKKRIVSIESAVTKTEKGDYHHFMLKEIMEQKETIARAIGQDERQIKKVANMIKKARGTFLIGCGTAGKVCLAAEYLFARVAKIHVNTIFGSEFDTQEPFLTNKTLLIAVSQSGETADILEAMAVAKQKGVKIVGVVNTETSSVARQSDAVLPIKAGQEQAVASTKATTAQLAILMLLAYATADRLAEGRQVLANCAAQINDLLNPRYAERICALACEIQKSENIYIIGKAENYAMALEAAIKIQEVSYIHAEGFAAGELKHGPLALITKGTPLIAFVPSDKYRTDVLTNTAEVKARGGFVIGVSPKNDKLFDWWIRVPDCGPAQPIVNIIPIQLLAYYLAILRQNNPDMPRNLAKSVTVK